MVPPLSRLATLSLMSRFQLIAPIVLIVFMQMDQHQEISFIAYCLPIRSAYVSFSWVNLVSNIGVLPCLSSPRSWGRRLLKKTLGSLSQAMAASTDEQRTALMDFYGDTHGEDWLQGTDWGSDSDYCSWYGIGCDGLGNVTSLNLRSNKLNGALTHRITKLIHLQDLHLSSNNLLRGAIPKEISLLVTCQTCVYNPSICKQQSIFFSRWI